MRTLDLGTLPPEEAKKLVLTICPRIDEHAPRLARLCGYLPLAIRVSTSLLETNDTREVAHYLDQLEIGQLEYLSDPDNPNDPQVSVEASLRLSYDALEPAAQSALCQISVFPTSFDLEAAKAVVVVEDHVIEVLELLRRRSLLEWDATAKRYSLPDLVRAFAAARLENADAMRLRHARHYAKVAASAQFDLYLKGDPLTGLRLFDSERAHIDAGWGWALWHAGDQHADRLLLDYANATAYVGDLRYDTRRERLPQWEAQLAAARRMGQPAGEGSALGNLGNAYAALGDARKAIDFYEQRLVIAREIGDRRGEAADLGNLGLAYAALGDARKAIDFYEQRLVIAREIGDRRGEGNALGNLGNAHAALGDACTAITFHEQHLAVARELGDRRGEALASWNLGLALQSEGDLARAAAAMQVCVDFERDIGHPNAKQDAATLGELRQRLAASQSATSGDAADMGQSP